MHRLRAILAAFLVVLLGAGPSFGATTQQTKKSPSMFQQLGTATTGFFKGVKNTLTPKKKATAKAGTKAKPAGLASVFKSNKTTK